MPMVGCVVRHEGLLLRGVVGGGVLKCLSFISRSSSVFCYPHYKCAAYMAVYILLSLRRS